MFDEARGRLLRAVAGQEPHRRPAAPGSRVVLATVPIGGRLQRQPEDVEADAQWGVMETAAGYAGVSRVHDHSDLRPTVDVDEKEARLLVRRAIEQLGPLGAKVSPFPGDTAVASVPSSSGPTQEYGAPKTIPCECASSRWRKLDQDAFRQNQRRLPFNLHARIGL